MNYSFHGGDCIKYSEIAKKYLEDLDLKEPGIRHRMITYGNLEMMEDLFVLFGGNKDILFEKTGCIGHHYKFKYVMDKLDYESKKENAIFKKGYIKYSGIINRPTRCFMLVDEM